ncbi:class I SAM-dependent methyltransferase [Phenylobacterium soli]|uniref:SAM-dependent methyltransferase n=1 Tax=Phenylobacterium soli TaxID=2170551 RepID=A0A328AQL2_9CAUL|nr:class I SAM-dependent methyltransferase [Phenylobacterium soli]RAK56036.1 SAM-dependent methyltransferase [Phenylobacterium soli]
MSEAPNAGQVAYWNETAGRTWADAQAPLDRQLAPLGARGIAELAPTKGERILDIGCGAGASSLALAEAVGPSGEVLGLDISGPLLALARRRGEGRPQLRFEQADAQTAALPPAGFDGAFSRFGVMFFADPTAAFANIRKALKPGGRLAFVCWRRPDESPIMTLPMQAALPHLPEPPPPPTPGAPGPFAFADPERVQAILTSAGFGDVAITPYDEKVGAGDLATVLDLAFRIGPLGAILRDRPELRPQVEAAVRAALAEHEAPDGVKLNAAVWIVAARA